MPVPMTAPHMLPTGGDAAVGKKHKPPLLGNVVKTYNIDGTTIHICDDCIVKTKEEVDAIISRFLTIGAEMIREVRERERREQEMEATI